MTTHVSICEVGPRDGLQIAKTRMTTEAKVRWIEAIAAAGVQEIEVGSFVPPRVIPQLSDTPEVVEQSLKIRGLTVQALAPNLRGVQNAYNAGVHKISIPVSVSEGHSMANLNRMPAQSIEMMREITAWLKSITPGPLLKVEIQCPHCGADMSYPFDLYGFFLPNG